MWSLFLLLFCFKSAPWAFIFEWIRHLTYLIYYYYITGHISVKRLCVNPVLIHTCILPYTQGVVWWEWLGRRWSGPDQIHSLTDQKATTDQETLQPKWEKTGGCWQIQFSEMTAGQGRNTTLCPCTEHIDKCIDKFAVVMKLIQRKWENAFY